MNGDQTADVLWLILAIVLVGSGLLAHRLPIGKALAMFASWALIFGAAFLIFALKDDFLALGKRVIDQERGQVAEGPGGQTLRIRQQPDGHFWVDARVNGQSMRFLIDSGATTTSLSSDAARRAGIETGGLPAAVNTANGMIMVDRGRADRVAVGNIERRDLAVHVSDTFGDTNVLGMNFLSSLSSWGVEGQWLILRA